jgi:two-component system sensor histidine kinase TctE
MAGRCFLLRELLSNLIHNAIEHAGRGSRVTVRTHASGGDAVLEVEDDGPGIAPEERAAVFDRFRRGSAASGNGSGLGLAIVRDIVKGHAARVEIVDPASGRGVILRVTFPGTSAAA